VAEVHRGRAGVVGLPGDGELLPRDALHARDRSDGDALGLEHRPLLDVQLEIGGCRVELAARFERSVEVDPVRRERPRHREAGDVAVEHERAG